MRMLRIAALALLAAALPSGARADAFHMNAGIQTKPRAAAPTKDAANGSIWINSAGNVLSYTNPAGATVTIGGGGTYNQVIEDEGVAVTQRSNLNFVGAGVTCADSGGKTVCTVTSGGSTGNWTFTGDAADDSGAAVLTIGATTATGVTLSRTAGTITMAGDTVFGANKGVTVTAGTSSFNFSGGTGTFLTSSGANTLSGTTTLAANKNFVYAAGTGTFDGSASSGAFTTSTGTNTLSGNVVISGSKTFTTGTGTATINGDLQMASGKHIYGGASTSAADFSAGSGIFKTTTGAASYLGSSNVFTSSINPLTDSAEDIGDGATTKFWRVGYINDISFKSSTGPFTIGSYGAANPYLSLGDTSCSTGAWSGACNRIRGLSAQTTLDVAPAVVTGLTASAEYVDVLFNFNRGASDTQHATGDYANQRAFLVTQPRYSFVGSSTITDAATVAIEGAPIASTNAIITDSHALWVMDGKATFENNNVGATVGTAGAWLRNRIDATSGNQKYSPALIWSGNGWKTNATAASQSTKFLAQLIPVEGAANPTVGLSFQSNVNAAGWVERLNVGSTAILASVPITANLGSTTVAPTWTAVTYTNSWVDFNGSNTTRYSKNALGRITIEIRAKNGSTATSKLCDMPAGYRPGQTIQFVGQTLAGGIAAAEILTTGEVNPTVSSTSGIFLRAEYFAEN